MIPDFFMATVFQNFKTITIEAIPVLICDTKYSEKWFFHKISIKKI